MLKNRGFRHHPLAVPVLREGKYPLEMVRISVFGDRCGTVLQIALLALEFSEQVGHGPQSNTKG